VLSIKPWWKIKGGVVAEAGRQRTRAKALSAVAKVAASHAPLRRLALISRRFATTLPRSEALIKDGAERNTPSSSPTWPHGRHATAVQALSA